MQYHTILSSLFSHHDSLLLSAPSHHIFSFCPLLAPPHRPLSPPLSQTRIKELLPLTETLLQQCSEERTRDFTLALLDFTQWDEMVNSQRITPPTPVAAQVTGPSTAPCMESQGPGSDTVDVAGHVHYVWPDFILDLLIQPSVWAAWRKRVERGEMTGGRNNAETLSKSNADSNNEVEIISNNFKRKHRPVTRRKAYFDALCSDRMAEIERFELEKI